MKLKITGHTKVVGIYGDPVGHSVSPAMHNAAFEALGLGLVYVPFRVVAEPAGVLETAVAAIKALSMLGMNITIPHKERVIRCLDEVDEHAREVGAVNTVLNRNGVLVGCNTDGSGYMLSLREETGLTPKGKRVLVIGAGGAARAVLYSILASGSAEVFVANRTTDKAETLASEFGSRFKKAAIKAIELDISLENLPERAVVSDIVYCPLETGLLKKARVRGLKTHNGLSMLVRQGAITFELWTGRKAPIEVMKKAALEALGGTFL